MTIIIILSMISPINKNILTHESNNDIGAPINILVVLIFWIQKGLVASSQRFDISFNMNRILCNL